MPGLHDLPTKALEPQERIHDILRQGVSLPRRKWTVSPEWSPPSIEGSEGLQRVIEGHFLPRQWQMLMDLLQKMGQFPLTVKRPNWIDPPISAIPLDARTDVAVPVVGGAPGAVAQILTFTVPDRCVGVLKAFGHEITNPAQWGNLQWTIRINEKPLYLYNQFRQQTGAYLTPTPFASHFLLKAQDVVEVIANQTVAVNVTVLARLMGYVWPAYEYTQDGSFTEQKTF